MKVWNPNTDKIENHKIIASNMQDLGNAVAEGRLEKTEFWEALYKATLGHAVASNLRTAKRISALQSDNYRMAKIIDENVSVEVIK